MLKYYNTAYNIHMTKINKQVTGINFSKKSVMIDSARKIKRKTIK